MAAPRTYPPSRADNQDQSPQSDNAALFARCSSLERAVRETNAECVSKLSGSGRRSPIAQLAAHAGVVLLDLGVGVLLGLLQRCTRRHAVEHLLLGVQDHVAHTLVITDHRT